MKRKINIAIDGYSSCGKSTLAKDLAKELQYVYIDSGAMYRAVTLFALRNKLITASGIDTEKLKELIGSISINFKYNSHNGNSETYLNGENVEQAIRSLEVSSFVSQISELGFVREKLVMLQQEMGKNKGVVMDGRDIGTVVFPDAELKIFMTASHEVRTKRRFEELMMKGENASFEMVSENLKKRDYIDTTRKISPLTKANDAIVLDNSFMSRKEQLDWVLQKVNMLAG